MAENESKTYPVQIWLAKGSDGKNRFYNSDPKDKDVRGMSEIELAEELFQFYGVGDVVNPVVFKIRGLYLQRAENFNVAMPGRIRNGNLMKHFEDTEGNLVEILQTRSPDPAYPFNGIAISREGDVVGKRLYNGRGECRDGVEGHRIYVFEGALADNGEADADDEQQ